MSLTPVVVFGQFTSAEQSFLSTLAGLSYSDGDILYAVSGDLTNLAIGTTGQVLQVSSGGIPEWATVSGTGDVTAASAFGTDNRLIRSDGTGKGVQASAVTVDDSGNISGLGTLNGHTIPGGAGTLALTSDITGISNVVEDTTPQLGGDLDAQDFNITSVANIGLDTITADSTSGGVQIRNNAGTAVLTVAAGGTTNTNASFAGALTIGGQLGGVTALDATTEATIEAAIDTLNNLTTATNLAITASQVTSGTFADARIAESNVTQHEAAINALNLTNGPAQANATANPNAIDNVLEDTSPQLGGNLDTNGHHILVDTNHGILDSNGNEYIIFVEIAAAVNYLEVYNGDTGNGPSLVAAGGDTNIDLELWAKGTGSITLHSDLDMNGNNIVDTQEVRLDATPDSDHSATGLTTDTINAGATVAQSELVYLASDGEWALADADATATTDKFLAVALEAGTDGNPLLVALPGSFVRDDTWNWTVGGAVYVSTTAGGLTQTAPSATDDVVRVVGYAVTADVIWFSPEPGVVHA